MGGSGISWTIHKSSEPHLRQIAMPAPRHSIFYRPNALPDTQPTASQYCEQSPKAEGKTIQYNKNRCTTHTKICKTQLIKNRCSGTKTNTAAVNVWFPIKGISQISLKYAGKYSPTISVTIHFQVIFNEGVCLQCFDAVGWAAGRASGP